MNTPPNKKRSPWSWIPTLYFAEGLPYTIVMLLSVVFYKRMGISNTDIALYTSWLYLPWVLKPLWSPVVDILRTKRFWIIAMQLLIGAGLGGVVLSIPLPSFFQYTLGFLWLLAFSSATHDIAIDGFYMLGLSKHDQAWFVGVRSTFYRLSVIAGQGLLIMFAGYVESNTGLPNTDVSVIVDPQVQVLSYPDIDEIDFLEQEGELRIITNPPRLIMGIQPRSQIQSDSLISFAKQFNAGRQDIGLLLSFLKSDLAHSDLTTSKRLAGNMGIVLIHLSKPPDPDQEIVVSFGQDSGDKNIKLRTGTRSVFTHENWNIPVMAIFQLHPKLDSATSAIFQGRSGNIPLAWSMTFLILTGLFLVFFVYHKFILPHPDQDVAIVADEAGSMFANSLFVFKEFFSKKQIVLVISFILLYRFGEAQLVKIAPLFMLDSIEVGGLGLTTSQYGFMYGTLGVIALTLGGLLGGFVAARQGLKFWILWMALAMKLPDIVYVYLSYVQPESFSLIASCVAFEQFGYGFGFTAFMLYMITVAEGKHKTAHYAMCTGFMALGMMIPGMFSGWLQEQVGYEYFFIWVLLCTIPGLLLIKFLVIDPKFGRVSQSK